MTDRTVPDRYCPECGPTWNTGCLVRCNVCDSFWAPALLSVFLLGFEESASGFGRTYDDDPESPRSVAYDRGRTFGESVA